MWLRCHYIKSDTILIAGKSKVVISIAITTGARDPKSNLTILNVNVPHKWLLKWESTNRTNMDEQKGISCFHWR